MRPDIPFSEYKNEVAKDIYIIVDPIALKIEAGEIDDARGMLGRLTLWFLDHIEKGELEPWKARNAYFLLSVWLTDNFSGDVLGEDAHELIYEGTLLHEYGKDMGPDIKYMRKLATELVNEANPDR